VDDESELHTVTFGDEYQVVLHPQSEEESCEIAVREIVLQAMFVDDETFSGQGPSHLIVHLTSFFLICLGAGDTGEASKEPLHHGVDRIDSGLNIYLRLARGDVESH